MMGKICSKCHISKPISEFNAWKQPKDKHFHMCKVCYREYYKQVHAKHFNSLSQEEKNISIIKQREIAKQCQRRLKYKVLSHYSNGIPKCANPFNIHPEIITDTDLLTIDHINGGGSRDAITRKDGKRLYGLLKKRNYPDGYQVLCANCQSKKRIINKECGRNRKAKTKNTPYNSYYYSRVFNVPDDLLLKRKLAYRDNARRTQIKLKLEALSIYSYNGNIQCVNPYFIHQETITDIDILQLDHINGNGIKDRINNGMTHSYGDLKRMGYPLGYQVLCANCNLKKRFINNESKTIKRAKV